MGKTQGESPPDTVEDKVDQLEKQIDELLKREKTVNARHELEEKFRMYYWSPLCMWSCIALLLWNFFLYDVVQYGFVITGVTDPGLPGKLDTGGMWGVVIYLLSHALRRTIDKLKAAIR